MNKTELLSALDDILELDAGTIHGGERLEDLENWDSLAVLSFIALVDEDLDIILDGDALAAAETVSDLVALVAVKLAA